MSRGARDWVSYWDADHPIYVNARHFDVHYRTLAEAIVRLVPSANARVLDYGCGEALHADAIAGRCAELYLCEAAPKLRARLKQRFARVPNIAVISPEELERVPPSTLDLVVANSVVQYLARTEFERLLALLKRRIKMSGQLVIADVTGPKHSALADAFSLLKFAAKNGFLLAALFGLVRTIFSPYRSLRARLGLSQYSEPDMLALLRSAGFYAERMPENLGHDQTRMGFRAMRMPEAGPRAA